MCIHTLSDKSSYDILSDLLYPNNVDENNSSSTILIGIIVIPPNKDFNHEMNSPQKDEYSRTIQAKTRRKMPKPKLSI